MRRGESIFSLPLAPAPGPLQSQDQGQARLREMWKDYRPAICFSLLLLFFSSLRRRFSSRRRASSSSWCCRHLWKFSTTTPTNMFRTKKATMSRNEMKYSSIQGLWFMMGWQGAGRTGGAISPRGTASGAAPSPGFFKTGPTNSMSYSDPAGDVNEPCGFVIRQQGGLGIAAKWRVVLSKRAVASLFQLTPTLRNANLGSLSPIFGCLLSRPKSGFSCEIHQFFSVHH